MLSPRYLRDLLDLVNEEANEASRAARAEADALAERLAVARRKLENLYRAIEDGGLDPSILAPRIREVKGQVDDRTAQQARHATAGAAVVRIADEATIARYVERLRAVLATGTPNAQRTFPRAWVTRIETDGMKLTVTFTLPAELGGPPPAGQAEPGLTGVLPQVGNGGGGGSRTEPRQNLNCARYLCLRTPVAQFRDEALLAVLAPLRDPTRHHPGMHVQQRRDLFVGHCQVGLVHHSAGHYPGPSSLSKPAATPDSSAARVRHRPARSRSPRSEWRSASRLQVAASRGSTSSNRRHTVTPSATMPWVSHSSASARRAPGVRSGSAGSAARTRARALASESARGSSGAVGAESGGGLGRRGFMAFGDAPGGRDAPAPAGLTPAHRARSGPAARPLVPSGVRRRRDRASWTVTTPGGPVPPTRSIAPDVTPRSMGEIEARAAIESAGQASRGAVEDRRAPSAAVAVERVEGAYPWSGAEGRGERFRATTALEVPAFVRARPSGEVRLPGIEVAGWLAECLPGVGIQARLRGDPAGRRIFLRWLLQVDGRETCAARDDAGAWTRELLLVLGGCRHLRVEPVADPARLAGARLLGGAGAAGPGVRAGKAPTVGWWADVLPATVPGVTGTPIELPAPRAPDPLRIEDVVRLLLASEEPVEVVVSTAPARDPRAVHALRRHVSALRARLVGLSQGIHMQGADGRSTHRIYPDEMAALGRSAEEVAALDGWLGEVGRGALQVRVAVLGGGPAPRALLHAVQKARIGTPTSWRPLSEDQASALASGPLDALECPLFAREGDHPSHEGPLRVLAREWVPVPAAALALELPVPGGDGLPGIPLESGHVRPIPQSVVSVAGGALLGEADGPRGRVPVRIGDADLARHLYLVGKTGVGKSTALRSMLVSLARGGQGIGLIDPHGDLAEEVLRAVPSDRRVVVFDPSQPDCPGLDPLAHDGSLLGMERALEEITGIMFRLYLSEHMGPMFERFSRALLLPLLAARGSLADASRLPHDALFRAECLARLDSTDPIHAEVLRFWKQEYPGWGREMTGEMQTYTVSKYDALVRSSMLRRVCGPDRPQLDVGAIADRGDVLIARLPEGLLGPVSSWFLGMLLMIRLQTAVFARVARPVAERRPFTLAVDEFHHFLGGSGYGYAGHERTLGPLLSEARKFGLRLLLAHQFVDQLDDTTRAALLGNVGSIVCFRTGHRDAEILAPELGGGVTPDELRGLPVHQGVARLLHRGEAVAPFTLRTVLGTQPS